MTKRRTIITLPVLLGLGLLILGAYYDNIRGPLLPHIAKNMGFSYAGSSFFLVVGHICAGVATAALMPALNRFNERSVTWLCLGIGFVTCVAAMTVNSYWHLLVFAGAVGICTSLLGAMSNVVILANSAPERAGRNLALLHVMYGVGATLGTVLTGQVLARGLPWASSLLVLIPVILVLAWQARALPDACLANGTARRQPVGLGGEHWLVVGLFAAYVAGEVLTSMWMTTYLVEADGMDIGEAAWYATAFFVVMASSRLAIMIVPVQRWPALVLGGSLITGLIFSVLGLTLWRWCLPLVGLLGPFFPLLLARANMLYPQRNRTITIYVIVAMQVTLGSLHFLIGQVSQFLPVTTTYWIAPTCLILAVVLFGWHVYLISIKKRPIPT